MIFGSIVVGAVINIFVFLHTISLYHKVKKMKPLQGKHGIKGPRGDKGDNCLPEYTKEDEYSVLMVFDNEIQWVPATCLAYKVKQKKIFKEKTNENSRKED